MSKAKLAVSCSVFVVALIVGFLAGTPSASAHARTANTSAHSLMPSNGTCEWFTQKQTEWTYYSTYGSRGYHVQWDVYINELHNWATWDYCGYVQTQVCITTASDWPYGNIGVTNLWYADWHYLNGLTRWSPPVPDNRILTFCVTGYSYYVAPAHSAQVSYQFWDADGGYGSWLLSDDCVACYGPIHGG